jgi:hypothetical protein
MVFADFYYTGVISGELVSACGSDGVAVLDGRWSMDKMHYEAERIARQRGFLAYKIHRGETFNRCSPITELVRI